VPDISRILTRSREGDSAALEELLPVVYAELRRLAAAHMRRERSAHSMQPTDLVHAAYLKLLDGADAGWQNRTHFFAIAARAMRQILIDHARRRSADKRTNPAEQRITLSEATAKPGDVLDLLALDEALAELAGLDERKARVLELRFFGGLKNPEIAETLDVSLNTVEKDWYAARAWLRARLA
jgi:RNA polymerase sigma factor (TIGR02999 family)